MFFDRLIEGNFHLFNRTNKSMSHGLKHKTYAQKRTLTRQDATACRLIDIHTNTELEKEKPNLVCSACSITS